MKRTLLCSVFLCFFSCSKQQEVRSVPQVVTDNSDSLSETVEVSKEPEIRRSEYLAEVLSLKREAFQAAAEAVNREVELENRLSILVPSKELKPGPSRAVPKWFKRSQKNASRMLLTRYFGNHPTFELKPQTYAYIAKLDASGNVKKEYSLGNGAYIFSMTETGEEVFWPASTVKLAACVAALQKLSEYGLDGRTRLKFFDNGDLVDTDALQLCKAAIIPSSNEAYNRLVLIAGLDWINTEFLPKMLSMPTWIFQRRYVRKKKTDDLRTSPSIHWVRGAEEGMIDGHYSHFVYENCPREANCVTLAELAEAMRLSVFYKKGKLTVSAEDMAEVKQYLLDAPSCINGGVRALLGRDAKIYNKGGKVTSDDRLEVAVVSDVKGKERYLIALSVPYEEGIESYTSVLAGELLRAVKFGFPASETTKPHEASEPSETTKPHEAIIPTPFLNFTSDVNSPNE